MDDRDEAGLTPDAAAGYEAFFVPAIFHQWPPRLLDTADVKAGQSVLDVGCGTGALSRVAAERVMPGGRVVGIDLSDSMLNVARKHCPGVEFTQADAASLPFDDDTFDAACSAFMLMFSPSPAAVLAELRRVVKPTGAIAASVWLGLEANPIYRQLEAAVRDVVGAEAANTLAMPFALGSDQHLARAFNDAGLDDPQIQDVEGNARFPSVQEFVRIEIEAWLLAGQVDTTVMDDVVERLLTLAPSLQRTGEVVFPFNARIASWRRA